MFQIMTKRGPVKLHDPTAIRALAHPARLAVIEELYAGRELTATECAEIAGLSPSAMSYHLRNLEKHGIVERADSATDGRERPWRAAGSYLQVQGESIGDAASAALSSTVVARLAEQFGRWLATRNQDDEVWQRAAIVSSAQVWMLPEEVNEIAEFLDTKLEQYRDRRDDRPERARRVRVAAFAFPSGSPHL
jgi:DNA-binding transcriptional ArsR family regulator